MTKIDISPKWSEVKPQGFYVYLHRRATDGSVFYVGKGKDQRAWGRAHRNRHWNYISKKHGVVVDILRDDMSEVCAFTLEKVIISILGRENLANATSGGEGVSGITGEDNHNYDSDIYDFWHRDHGRLMCTKNKLRKTYGITASEVVSVCREDSASTHGWVLYKNRANPIGRDIIPPGENNTYDNRIYTIQDSSGITMDGTQYELRSFLKVSPSTMSGFIYGRQYSCRGWVLTGDCKTEMHETKKMIVRMWRDCLSYEGSSVELSKITGVNSNTIRSAAYRSSKKCMGWNLKRVS